MSEYDTYAKVYSAQGGKFSIIDLLRSFADPELEVNGMSRISDLHMKVGDPVRYRYDGDLEVIQGGEVLTEETLCQLVFPLITDEQRESFLSNRHGDLDAGFYWEEQKSISESISFGTVMGLPV